MKKKVFIVALISFLSLSLISYSQSKIEENLYIYVNNKSFWPDMLGYKAVFGIKSVDKRFSYDNYYFKISYLTPDHQSLYSIGKTINVDSLNYIENPIEYFGEMTACEVHNILSLYKQIFIITEIPESKLENEEDKSKKHIMWSAQYSGTNKDINWVNPNSKTLLEN